MDFTEPVRDEQVEVIEIGAVAPAPAPEPDLNKRLHSLKTEVFKQNKRMAEAYVRIAAAIEQIRERLPASKLKTFLVSECGLNRRSQRVSKHEPAHTICAWRVNDEVFAALDESKSK